MLYLPVNTDQRDVLEENAVNSYLLEGTLCKTDNKNAAIPCGTFHAVKGTNCKPQQPKISSMGKKKKT
jgi:hypothetical protein